MAVDDKDGPIGIGYSRRNARLQAERMGFHLAQLREAAEKHTSHPSFDYSST